MTTISTNSLSKIIIKHIKYELNEKQYIETGRLAHYRSVDIGRPVKCQVPPPLRYEPRQYGRPEIFKP